MMERSRPGAQAGVGLVLVAAGADPPVTHPTQAQNVLWFSAQVALANRQPATGGLENRALHASQSDGME